MASTAAWQPAYGRLWSASTAANADAADTDAAWFSLLVLIAEQRLGLPRGDSASGWRSAPLAGSLVEP